MSRRADRAMAAAGRSGLSVEQSWDSLEFFSQNALGRIDRGPASPHHQQAAGGELEDSDEWGEFGASDDEETRTGEPESEVSCVVPTLPSGRRLQLDILSTWGDVYYVGLTGIEVFDDRGARLSLAQDSITANPRDVNVLRGYGRDPRTVDKLLDGVNRTTDDLHMWLAPFTQGAHHTVTLDFGESKTISMIRVWNYNKSRIHAHRGAQDVTIELDGERIFAGTIAKATGLTEGAEEAAEHILFTTEQGVIGQLEAVLAEQRVEDEAKERAELTRSFDFGSARSVGARDRDPPVPALRPLGSGGVARVGGAGCSPAAGVDGVGMLGGGVGGSLADIAERPMTSAGFRDELATAAAAEQGYEAPLHPRGMAFELQLLNTWGDRHYAGLTAMEMYDEDGALITPLTHDMVWEADVDSVNVLAEVSVRPIPHVLFFSPHPTLLHTYTLTGCFCSVLDAGRRADARETLRWLQQHMEGLAHVALPFCEGAAKQVAVKVWQSCGHLVHQNMELLEDSCERGQRVRHV